MSRFAKQAQTEAEYWWQVCRGAEVMRAFEATPESEAWKAVDRHPVLLLPELVDAAEQVLGPSRATAGLRQMQQSLRGTPYFAPYHRMLAMTLGSEPHGSRRVNLERALAVMNDVRAAATGADRGTDDDQTEEALRAALQALMPGADVPAPAAVAVGTGPVSASARDLTWSRLFLDQGEMPGLQRGRDRRGVAPDPDDRVFAAHGGANAGSAEWFGNEESPVYRIVEMRWLFPSSKAARSYVESVRTLATAGEMLPRASAPTIADGAYAWGVTRPPRTTAPRPSRQIVMFRIGRVVAKLDVTEGLKAPQVFQVLSQEMLLPYVEAIVRRTRWALSQYWLAIACGTEAANRFVQTPPRGAMALFAEYPILLLPEFPTAMASLGDAHRAAAERLIGLYAPLKSNWQTYCGVMRALVRALLDEPHGHPRVNADAALELVIDHRRLDSDFAWAAVEAECRERA